MKWIVKLVGSDVAGASPQSRKETPGARMFKVHQTLKQKIQAKKAKEFAERIKLHEMYSEDKKLEDKNTDFDPLPDDEEIEDEMTESEIDEMRKRN